MSPCTYLLNEYKQRGLIPIVWCCVHLSYWSTCDVSLCSLCVICFMYILCMNMFFMVKCGNL
jgi:hypothetical protein